MKKILITILTLFSLNSFSATAKYTIADVEATVWENFVSTYIKNQTSIALEDLFNQKTASILAEKQAKDSTFSVESIQNRKLVLFEGFKGLLSDLGYESNLEIRDKDLQNIEIALYLDKDITVNYYDYIVNIINGIFSNLYGEEASAKLNLYGDANFKTLKQ